MEFDNCPRCGGKWTVLKENDGYNCSDEACDLYWSKYDWYITKDFWPYTIYWSLLHSEKCYVFTTEENIISTQIELCWLPFDITEEQLKLFITFS